MRKFLIAALLCLLFANSCGQAVLTACMWGWPTTRERVAPPGRPDAAVFGGLAVAIGAGTAAAVLEAVTKVRWKRKQSEALLRI